MPYKSDAQRRFMHAKHPEIAERWDKEEKKEHSSIKALKKHGKKAKQHSK